eukprot:15112170-Heterocapsa_arctica.AAC.1
MQTIDGDEFMNDKEVIRLRYCNKRKWGDAEHHYDLMYPIPKHLCNNKCYELISDEEQTLYQTNEKTYLEEQQRQTNLGNKDEGQNKAEQE